MKKLMKKSVMYVVRTGAVVLLTKVLVEVVGKLRKPSTTEKIDELIDEKAEKAKEIAKTGAHKTIDAIDVATNTLKKTDLGEKVTNLRSEVKSAL